MRSVIVGGGIAGLGLAIELSRHGWQSTIVESRYPGAGNSTRNVGRVRRMQLTPELTAFACRASDKWTRLEQVNGGRNPLLYPTKYIWALYGRDERELVEPMQPMWDEHGARARVVEPEEVRRALPILDGGEPTVGAVIGDAAIVHHDAAVYAYLLAAREAGVEFAIGATALAAESVAGGIDVQLDDGRVLRGDVAVNAAGGNSGAFARASGADAPNAPLRREVLVTEPSRPFMDAAVTFYRPQEGWFNQTLRGELVAGVVDVDEAFGMNEDSSLEFLARTARVLLAKAPRLAELRVVRQWAGVYDTTPDKCPLVGRYPGTENFFALNGWSGRGILLAPLAAELLAREIARGERDPLLVPFDPARFADGSAQVAATADYYSGYAH